MKAIPKQFGDIMGFSALESRTRAALATSPPVLWHTKNRGRPIFYRSCKFWAKLPMRQRAFGWHTSWVLVPRKRSRNWPAKESKLSPSAGIPWSRNITLVSDSISFDSVMSQGSNEPFPVHVLFGSAPMAGTATILCTVICQAKNEVYLVIHTLFSFRHWSPGLYSAFLALPLASWFHLPPLSCAAQ